MPAQETPDRVEALLAGLNPPQREAVTAGAGPLLILAGAGSGKTRVLTHRIAYLLRTGQARADEILAITFTNKAAQEMRERVELLVGRATRAMWVMTFHSACARMLRADAHRLGYTRQFTIYDSADQRRLIKKCLDDLDIDPKRFTPRAMQVQISDAKNKLRAADDYRQMVGSFFEQTVADVYESYERELHRANAMDFDDLLFRAVNLLELFQEVRDRYTNAFRWILVDEYQDTNRAQYRWLQLLTGEDRNLAVVGDDDQCLVEGTLVTMADGSKRPIEDIREGDEVLSSYGSGEFRAARVSAAFKSIAPWGVAVSTASGRRIVSTPEHTHFAAFKTGHTAPAHLTYLMFRRDKGYRIGVTRTYRERDGKGFIGLALRARQEYADACWVVDVHASEAEARAQEAELALRYQLPTIPFLARLRATDNGLVANQALIDRVFAAVDTELGAIRLLADTGLDPWSPHQVTRTFEGRRRTVTVTLCADRRGAAPLHLLTVGGRSDEARRALESAGLVVRDGRTPGSWRYETISGDLGTIEETVAQLRSILDVHVKRVARLGAPGSPGSKALSFTPAGSVKPGMVMFGEDGEFDVVTTVERVPLETHVYDLNIEGTHNFIADGVITHNSVYGFRGADITNILNFEDDYVDAHVVRLEQNYRSTQTILSAANAVVANNRGRKSKSLWTELGEGDPIKVRELADEHAEARFVAAEIERLVDEGVSRSEIAVFYRTNAQSRVLEDMLVRAQIGYQVIGGTKFYERAEIKDAVAYLTFIVNPADGGAFTRIANSPKRGIGQTSLSRVLAHADTMGITPWEAAAAPENVPSLGTAAQKALGRFMSTMARFAERVESGAPVAELLEETLRESGYLDALEAERTIEAQGRIENLQEFVHVAREYDGMAAGGEDTGVAEFLQQIALLADADQIRDDEGLVTLMTLHNAKGLEFPIVFIIGAEDGVFPHGRAIDEGGLEEERRLAYVGITRAMRDLYITYARRRNVFGAESFGLRSRFIDEIPRELTDQPDRNAIGIGRPAGTGRVASWATAAAASAETAPGGGGDSAGQVFRMGDDVVHAAFGEGVVLGVEPGGIVVVHFASDGSQRKLMADYAPIRKR